MKRYKLIDARRRRGMDQTQLGKALGDVPRDTIGRWEDGTQEPRQDMVQKLCDLFGCTYSYELDLHAAFNCAPHREDELLQMLERLDRRQLIALFSKLSVFAGVDLAVLFSATLIAPDELLNLCRTVIDQCWLMLDQGSFSFADVLITECVAKLDPLARHMSLDQDQAASLCSEATIIQMIIATHSMNYKRRVVLGESAVKYGELSGDNNALVVSIGWHGNTFTNCYDQPSRAISILSKSAPLFNGNSRLNQADTYTELAKAYALNGDETAARNYVEQAHLAMPEHPELDIQYQMTELGQSELEMREGNMFLILAQRFPTKEVEYGKLAYGALVKSVNQVAISSSTLGYRLMHKANAARLINEKDDYLDSLTDGVHNALQLNSHKQITKAVTILNKTPHAWRTEQKYKDLVGLLTPNPSK